MKKLRSENFAGGVIFITSSSEHALAAFEVNARQYLRHSVSAKGLYLRQDMKVRAKDNVKMKTLREAIRNLHDT